jgi:hypothetical protein
MTLMDRIKDTMMKHCCGANGTPDFEKMKGFMIQCGKQDFSDVETSKMKDFCEKEGAPDFAKMKTFMEHCGCCLPDAEGETTEGTPSA